MDDIQLSENFWLSEFLRSQKASRLGGEVYAQQMNPPKGIINNLQYLATTTLQPIRTDLNCGITLNSGYRSPVVNKAVGSRSTSQHLRGEAGDVTISSKLMKRKNEFEAIIYQLLGKSFHNNVDQNGLLWCYCVMNLHNLDIDQVIHEFGIPGSPDWLHISGSKRQNKRQMLKAVWNVEKEKTEYIQLNKLEALRLLTIE